MGQIPFWTVFLVRKTLPQIKKAELSAFCMLQCSIKMENNIFSLSYYFLYPIIFRVMVDTTPMLARMPTITLGC